MSSDYRILCLSHDPGIECEQEWSNYAEPVELLRQRDASPGALRDGILAEHPNCDLVVGRYSAPLIEVCCVGPSMGGPHFPHRDDRWTDVGWLRLLWAANELPGEHRIGCWTRTRAGRLRLLL